jgi:hypothetical protein
MKYRFPSFDEAIRYDSFFERMYDDEFLPGISGKEVCFDLYGLRVTPLGKKYLLSCKKYDFPIVRTYGLRMRPQEQNAIAGIEGDGIYLYKVNGDETLYSGKRRKPASEIVEAKARYEVQGLTRRVLLPHTLRLYRDAVVRKLNKLFKE